jgi:hypothetical protein
MSLMRSVSQARRTRCGDNAAWSSGSSGLSSIRIEALTFFSLDNHPSEKSWPVRLLHA